MNCNTNSFTWVWVPPPPLFRSMFFFFLQLQTDLGLFFSTWTPWMSPGEVGFTGVTWEKRSESNTAAAILCWPFTGMWYCPCERLQLMLPQWNTSHPLQPRPVELLVLAEQNHLGFSIGALSPISLLVTWIIHLFNGVAISSGLVDKKQVPLVTQGSLISRKKRFYVM